MTAALPLVEPFAPLCMDADELAGWERMRARSTEWSAKWATPCDDCLVGFAAEMRAQGRCNGTPGGDEEDDMAGRLSPEGALRISEAAKRRAARQRAERAAADGLALLREREGDAEREVVAEWTRTSSDPRDLVPLTPGDGQVLEAVPPAEVALLAGFVPDPPLPCDGCLHAEVCRFRHLVAEPDGPLAFAREVAPGIRLRAVRVEVECDHLLAAIPA